MGNACSASATTDAFYGNAPLVPQAKPVVAINPKFCKRESVSIRVKISDRMRKVKFKDLRTGQALFQTGKEDQLRRLLDANKEEIATLKERTRHMKAVLSGSVELFTIYFKLGELNEQQSYEDTELRVELVDRATGKKSSIGIEGEWRSRSVVFWADRGEATPKEAVGKVHLQQNAVQGRYVLEIVANMDSALLVLVCAVLDDAMRTARLKEADRRMNGFNSQFSGAYVPQTTF